MLPKSTRDALRLAQELGRGNDTILAHINPREAAMLKKRGGSGKINPHTGLLEFDDTGDGGGDNPRADSVSQSEQRSSDEAARQDSQQGSPDTGNYGGASTNLVGGNSGLFAVADASAAMQNQLNALAQQSKTDVFNSQTSTPNQSPDLSTYSFVNPRIAAGLSDSAPLGSGLSARLAQAAGAGDVTNNPLGYNTAAQAIQKEALNQMQAQQQAEFNSPISDGTPNNPIRVGGTPNTGVAGSSADQSLASILGQNLAPTTLAYSPPVQAPMGGDVSIPTPIPRPDQQNWNTPAPATVATTPVATQPSTVAQSPDNVPLPPVNPDQPIATQTPPKTILGAILGGLTGNGQTTSTDSTQNSLGSIFKDTSPEGLAKQQAVQEKIDNGISLNTQDVQNMSQAQYDAAYKAGLLTAGVPTGNTLSDLLSGKLGNTVYRDPTSDLGQRGNLGGNQGVNAAATGYGPKHPNVPVPSAAYPAAQYVTPQNYGYQNLGSTDYTYGNNINWNMSPGYTAAANGGKINNNNAIANALRMLTGENKS